jgi:hypothetical protein
MHFFIVAKSFAIQSMHGRACLCRLVTRSTQHSIDDLLFLATPEAAQLRVSGDGVLRFSRLVASGLASFGLVMKNGPLILYKVALGQKGFQLINAWKSGDRRAVANLFGNGQPRVPAEARRSRR